MFRPEEQEAGSPISASTEHTHTNGQPCLRHTLPPAPAGSAARAQPHPKPRYGTAQLTPPPTDRPWRKPQPQPHLEQHLSRGLKHCCQAGAAAPRAAGPRTAASLRPVRTVKPPG